MQGQMTVNNNQTVEWYVQNVLLGTGVSVSNITVDGMPANQVNVQLGQFTDATDDIGLGSGLIMGSGDVTMAEQDNTGGGSSLPGSSNGYSDADLENLTPFSVNDQIILEFDFVPTGDTLSFNYAFASEEYPEYVCGTVNDVFGFFLSGNNPSGGTYNNSNIALIPDPADPTQFTTTPVSINTINPGVPGATTGGNSQNCDNADPNWADYNIFYLSNTTGNYEYDGQTVVLTARALVNCGETYHIKMGIGDGGDTAFDSAVFLEEGSFASNLAVSASLQSSIGPGGDGYLYENCGYGIIVFSRSGGIDAASEVELDITGVAQNGIDYTSIPTTFTFPAGDSLYYLDVYAILDALVEGYESVTISITNTVASDCATGTFTSEFSFEVADDPEPLSISTNDFAIDCGDPAFLAFDIQGGYGQYQYQWSNGSTDSSQTIFPGLTTDYIITVSDTCNAGSVTDTITVDVPIYPPLEVELADTTELSCLEVVDITPLTVAGGNGVYNYEWTQGAEVLGGNTQTLTYTGTATNLLQLTVTDGCFIEESDQMLMLVPVVPIVIETTSDTVLCAGNPITLNAQISGGEPPYDLLWSHYSASEDSILVSPQETTVYTIGVTDLCTNSESAEIRVTVSESEANFAVEEYGYFGVTLENFSQSFNSDSLYYTWTITDGTLSHEEEFSHIFNEFDNQTVTLHTINEHGCTDSASLEILAPPTFYAPTSFSPNGDGINDSFRVFGDGFVDFQMHVFDRWGREVFYTDDINEPWNGRGSQKSDHFGGNDTYVYRIRARMLGGQRIDTRGLVTLIR